MIEIKTKELPSMTPALLVEIRARVADGIALGRDYNSLFDRYVEAHNDRRLLLAFIDAASEPAPPTVW